MYSPVLVVSASFGSTRKTRHVQIATQPHGGCPSRSLKATRPVTKTCGMQCVNVPTVNTLCTMYTAYALHTLDTVYQVLTLRILYTLLGVFGILRLVKHFCAKPTNGSIINRSNCFSKKRNMFFSFLVSPSRRRGETRSKGIEICQRGGAYRPVTNRHTGFGSCTLQYGEQVPAREDSEQDH